MKYAPLIVALMLLSATPTASSALPSDPMAEIKSGWNCGACRCTFAGLDYTAAVDLRFETKARKEECKK